MLSLTWGPRFQRSGSTSCEVTQPNGNKLPMESRTRCSLCEVNFTSRTHADSHYNGRKHRKNLRRGQRAGSPLDRGSSGLRGRPPAADHGAEAGTDGPERSREDEAGHGFFCDVCGKNFSGPAPMKQHMQSLLHERRMRTLRGGGGRNYRDPAADANDDEESGLRGVNLPGRLSLPPQRRQAGGPWPESDGGGRAGEAGTLREGLIQLCQEKLQKEIAWAIPFIAVSVVDAVLDKIHSTDAGADKAGSPQDDASSSHHDDTPSPDPEQTAFIATPNDSDDEAPTSDMHREVISGDVSPQPSASSTPDSDDRQRYDYARAADAGAEPTGAPPIDDGDVAAAAKDVADASANLRESCDEQSASGLPTPCRNDLGGGGGGTRRDSRGRPGDGPDSRRERVTVRLYGVEMESATGWEATNSEDAEHLSSVTSQDLIDFACLNNGGQKVAGPSCLPGGDGGRRPDGGNGSRDLAATGLAVADAGSLGRGVFGYDGTSASRCHQNGRSPGSPSRSHETHLELLDVVEDIIHELDSQAANTSGHFAQGLGYAAL